jgi:FKBP-type peptidyl-prolyl cis-trans isomerase FkpA
MNKFKFYFTSIITTLVLFSCSKNNNDTTYTPVPLRDYQAQFNTDNTDIEEYLKTNYITIVDDAGMPDDQDVTIAKITDPTDTKQKSIYSYLNATTFPKLLSRPVQLHGITYTLYYLVLREGTGTESPTNTDGVLAAYSGSYLSRTTATTTVPSTITTTEFETVRNPQSFLDLYSLTVFGGVKGWPEVFPQFKTGTATSNTDGTISYKDFGAGVMFIPSGLAYYEKSQGTIPAYTPLIFSFKLYAVKRLDHEYYILYDSNNKPYSVPAPDGVFDNKEDLNSDKYMYDYRDNTLYPTKPSSDILYADDTDKDGIPDFLDTDDDGDGYSTKLEISKGTNPLDKNNHP